MVVYSLFFLFVAHFIFNLEKYILLNEIFVLFGIFFLILNIKNYMKFKQDKVVFIVLFLLCYGFFYSFYSFFFLRDGNVYQFARTLVFWYSIFGFFVGIQFFRQVIEPNKDRFLHKYSFLIGFFDVFLGGILSNFSLITILFYTRSRYLLWIFVFIVLMAIYKGGSTSFLILLSLLIFIFSKNKLFLLNVVFNKWIIFILLTFGFYILHYMYVEYNHFFNIGYVAFGDDVDNNMIWRLMYWSYEFSENIINHPIFGIGFGTPLFDINREDLSFIIHNRPEDSVDLPYIHGTHNSFLYVLIRMGLVGFIPLLSIYFIIFYRVKKYKLFNDNLVVSLLLSFIFISVAALFNVVLESGLYAGSYWIIVGMLYKSIEYKKYLDTRN